MIKHYLRSPSVKFFLVAVLTLILMIPMAFVSSLVSERESRFHEVESTIAREWGARQYFAGPMILIPVVERSQVDGVWRQSERLHVVLPDAYAVNAALDPSTKKRGLFSVGVYRADITGTASFDVLAALRSVRLSEGDVLWERARVAFPVADTRSLDPASTATIGETALRLEPGVATDALGATGVSAPLSRADVVRPFALAFDFTLNGSSGIDLLPVGDVTQATIAASDLSPSFGGGYLPQKTEVDGKGFLGEWTISSLGRSFPKVGNDLSLLHAPAVDPVGRKMFDPSSAAVGEGAYSGAVFGASLVTSTDFYASVERSTKYAILFVGLTFLAFFLIEVLARARVHPIQYVLVGVALALFYLLLLALAEHVGFGLAYATATAMTVFLVSGYVRTILGSRKFALLIGAFLALLYGYLYAVLRMDDYALLFGTALLFLVLTGVMYATRRVDWYAQGTSGAGEKE